MSGERENWLAMEAMEKKGDGMDGGRGENVPKKMPMSSVLVGWS